MTNSVLVIDDNSDFRTMMGSLLTRAGFECQLASSAEQALDRLRNGQVPALIVTDLHMDGMSGSDLLYRLRSDDSLRGIPILLVSNDDAGARIARETGFDSFVDKPHLFAQLAITVQTLLAARASSLFRH